MFSIICKKSDYGERRVSIFKFVIVKIDGNVFWKYPSSLQIFNAIPSPSPSAHKRRAVGRKPFEGGAGTVPHRRGEGSGA
jgi:hypothetical protein